ncbi:type II toxin-antitoxin system ParD family antitoxin [Sphingomonas sp. GB1N7]
MNISLPESLKAFVDEQVTERDFGTSSEYIRELIRKERDRERLRSLLLEGADSPPGAVADAQYFEGLKARIRNRAKK